MKINIKGKESLESLIKRFRFKINKNFLFERARKKLYYKKKSVIIKEKKRDYNKKIQNYMKKINFIKSIP